MPENTEPDLSSLCAHFIYICTIPEGDGLIGSCLFSQDTSDTGSAQRLPKASSFFQKLNMSCLIQISLRSDLCYTSGL